MLQELTDREAYLVYQFRKAGTQNKAIVSASLRVPLTDQETRDAIELYLEQREGPADAIEREVLETGFARSNQDYSELMADYIQGLAEAQ